MVLVHLTSVFVMLIMVIKLNIFVTVMSHDVRDLSPVRGIMTPNGLSPHLGQQVGGLVDS
jgi:hypothetical protein